MRPLSRRTLLQSAAALTTLAWMPRRGLTQVARDASGLGFESISGSRADAVLVPPGYDAQVLLRWGDALGADTVALDTRGLADGVLLDNAAAGRQARQFGYNCDALEFFALDPAGRRGVLCVNHEYTNVELMFPGRRSLGREGSQQLGTWMLRHPQACAVELAAHGLSFVEVERVQDEWRMVPNSRLTRRVTGTTAIQLCGPAAGHRLLRTGADPSGRRVLGTLANCAGGKTPWGTYLTAEENIRDYFGGYRSWRDGGRADGHVAAAHARLPLHEYSYHGWEYLEPRFDVRREPNEALRFGWIVEFDPRDPTAPGRKRTALGRGAHEGATCTLGRDGHAVVYSGDDERFEYLYKFVSRDRFDPRRPAANRDLLDRGTLYVACFDDNGEGEWRPLVHGDRGPLDARAGFADQAEVLVRTRAAADLLGATPMDRPEDIAIDSQSARVYVAFTKNAERTVEPGRFTIDGREFATQVCAANPRPGNDYGHILELDELEADAAATRFRWRVLLLAGDPGAEGATHHEQQGALRPGALSAHDTYYAGASRTAGLAALACPDNLSVDAAGNLWIVTDGIQPTGSNNGCFVMPTAGAGRGQIRQFMSAPVGSEVCGCEFTPDGETLFLSIQHPGEGGSLASAVSDWPDGGGLPARPSVVAIRRRGGGRIGT